MKTPKYILYFVLCTFVLSLVSCEPKALTAEDVLVSSEEQLTQELAKENPNGYTIYNINDLLDTFCTTEEGNFMSDSSLYRTRSYYNGLYLFSIDTLPTNGPGIYIRGRVVTDDYGGNFYKTLVIQQTKDWTTGADIDQQNLRISVDMGSAGGMFQQGQEIIIRCNGLAIGRYANQPQLCIPSNNNNIYASSATQKVGWAPGRIPSARFRKATRLIGAPDKSKLVYETLSLEDLDNKYLSKYEDVVGAREIDGRLVKITDVHFTGEYDNYGAIAACTHYSGGDTATVGNPELDANACTFGPTTKNVGYPQSRYVKDASETHKVLVSTSEYAKYAYYYLPAAKYVGSITGVLSYYMDNGNYEPDGGEWSISPNDMGDILPECQKEDADPRWIPTEWKKGTPQPEE
ncbi:MAG: DUF5689 domain-containing protein [Paludibacteraceae bacterium]